MSKVYECKEPVELTRKDFERINKFFKVDFDDESPEMEALINELDARPNTNPFTFWWNFENGAVIQIDIESTDSCYIDSAFIIDPIDNNDYWIDGRSYSLDETMVFFDGEDNYICRIKIVDKN